MIHNNQNSYLLFQKQCVDVYCPEFYHKEDGQCVLDKSAQTQKLRSIPLTKCFQVMHGSGNITDDIATLVLLKYHRLYNQNLPPDSTTKLTYLCSKDDMHLGYVCFQHHSQIMVSWAVYSNTMRGFAIHITNDYGLYYSMILSAKYLSEILRTHTWCKFNPNSIHTPLWELVDISQSDALLKNYMCDIDDGELDPTLNVVIRETVRCQIHTDVFTNDTNDNSHQTSVFDVDVILSYGMSAVSITSLAPTLLYNARYVSRWPLPKRILYHQVLTLFLSHLVTVVGLSANDIVSLCKTAGVLIHYLWLTVYCWTSIFAWHMYAVFAARLKSLRIIDKHTVTWLYLRYRLVGYLLPLLIVSPAAFWDIFQSTNIYGPNVCYLSDYEALLFLFMIPISLSCFFNILVYFTTTYNIVLNTRNMSVLKYDCVFYMKLFLKMWFMLSLASVSAIFAVIINNTIVWYIFICMYGVQSIASSILLGFHKKKK